MPYEGAGFLLKHGGRFILGVRVKKPDDTDKTPEVEYAGGKVDLADGNRPAKTAENELIEELGTRILDADWEQRAVIRHTYQPFTKKWIWCFELELRNTELQRVIDADSVLRLWNPAETRDFTVLTGRSEPSRKALAEIVSASVRDFTQLLGEFHAIPASANRMSDAKKFTGKLPVVNLDGTGQREYRIRAFNMVIFEEHFL